MPTARKQHYCCCCNKLIIVGESYVKETFTPWSAPDNEGFYTYKAHVECHYVFRGAWAEGVPYGEGIPVPVEWGEVGEFLILLEEHRKLIAE